MPRVLILCEYATLNGGEYSMLATLPHLRSAGCDISVAAPPKGDLKTLVEEQCSSFAPFSTTAKHGQRLGQDEIRRELAELISPMSPDLVHANSLAMSRLVGPVAKSLGVNSIGHIRDILSLSKTALRDINSNTRIVAVSRAAADYHVAAGLDAAKTAVIYNGVDLDEFRPRRQSYELHRELGVPNDCPIIGSIGQIGMRKGLDVLLDAFGCIATVDTRPHLVIVGERHSTKDEAVRFEARLRAKAARPPLAARVHFVGRRNDVPLLLNEFSLLAHAAKQEPLGRVLLEAAAAGTPVVATDVGGTREIFPLDDAPTALIVPAGDCAVFSDAMRSALIDPERSQRMARAARRRAEALFSSRTCADNMLKLYREVAG
jgi:glycosyltransferase involved in cell wall biosynthesis